jgi:hypothetical protein
LIPIIQTKFTSLDNVIHGNCLAACVASLVECDIREVPALEDMPSDGSWFAALWTFLSERGYSLEGTFYPRPDEKDWWPRLLKQSGGVDGFFLVGGSSPRPHVKRGHCVIFRDGALVHDPHPSGEGILVAQNVLMIEPIAGLLESQKEG